MQVPSVPNDRSRNNAIVVHALVGDSKSMMVKCRREALCRANVSSRSSSSRAGGIFVCFFLSSTTKFSDKSEQPRQRQRRHPLSHSKHFGHLRLCPIARSRINWHRPEPSLPYENRVISGTIKGGQKKKKMNARNQLAFALLTTWVLVYT